MTLLDDIRYLRPLQALRSVRALIANPENTGEVKIRIESEGIAYTGRGADTDIIVASARAYMNALNRLLSAVGEK